jgi:hypothetical protein
MKTTIPLKAELGRCMVLTAMLLAAVGYGGTAPDSSEAQSASNEALSASDEVQPTAEEAQAPSEAERLTASAVAGLELAHRVTEAPNPTEAYQALSETERQTLEQATRPVRMVTLETRGKMPTQANVEAAAGCWRAVARFAWKAAAGNTLYTAWQGLHWCSRNSRITSYYVFDRGGETATPGWSYDGPGGQAANNVGWEVRQYTQEKFKFSLGPINFTNTRCIQVRGGATGLYSSRESCNLY